MKTAVFINQVAGPMMVDIVNNFAQNRCEVTLITGCVESTFSPLSDKVHLVLFTPYNRRTFRHRIYTWTAFYLRCFFYLLFRPTSSLLFLVSNPPFLPFLGWLFSVFKKQRYAVLIYDIYPDILVSMKLLSADSFIVRLWHRINTIVYRRADAVITLSEGMAKTLGNRASIPVSVIPPWACVEEVVPIPKSQNPFAIHHSQVDKFTVLYSGNFGKTHPLETLIEVARQLQAYPQIHFLLIGGGVKYAALQQLSSRYRLQNITFLDWLPADQLRFSLPCADVSVVALDDSSGTMSVPSKTFYMLSAGSALLALGSPDSEISRLCAQYHCGQAFLSTQITEISNFLLHLYKNPEKRFQLQYASRQSSLDFTPKNAKDYWKILNKK